MEIKRELYLRSVFHEWKIENWQNLEKQVGCLLFEMEPRVTSEPT